MAKMLEDRQAARAGCWKQDRQAGMTHGWHDGKVVMNDCTYRMCQIFHVGSTEEKLAETEVVQVL